MSKEKIKEREKEIIKMVSEYCDDELNEEYKNLAIALVEKMGRKHEVPFKRGKLEIGASAVIYALGQINFLFDKSFEPHKTADDICNYFNTKKSTVSQKAKVIRDMFNMYHGDEEFSTEKCRDSFSGFGKDPNGFIFKGEDMFENTQTLQLISDIITESSNSFFSTDTLMDLDEFKHLGLNSITATLDDYEHIINEYKKIKGKEYFEENKGFFWGLAETRPFMRTLDEYATRLWDAGKKEKAVETFKYMIDLNPDDNQGIRYPLVNYLINLNKYGDALELINEFRYEESAIWYYSLLLIAIKQDLDDDDFIQELFEAAYNTNPYIVDYIISKKEIYEVPPFYSPGDESEAEMYMVISEGNWNDKKAIKTLKKLMEKSGYLN